METSAKKKSRQLISTIENEVRSLKHRLSEKEDELANQKKQHVEKYGPIYLCRICGVPHDDQQFAESYKDLLICKNCCDRAVRADGTRPVFYPYDEENNPLFIDGIKIWHRATGSMMMIDEYDFDEFSDFIDKHFY